ncbi:hypothetical protein PHYSODRAFT_332293 [Phytophthora sojae]|uniref:PHD-type domain-containing protein n=1 Tax=Phytophthora sojae (strain P6497) TaxID=1094619 RepID=G4ZFP7_PHYSP|nr:hypothetical protein PHYSODRAFT_332293 [Phytophthora sojae]EGZ18515.1 hypothetical protein PHYSODRAFT_332293 [Phytophthora sojae]|eukprot:XP_009527573.1 hypothetical protein PHYSODRAFT_332293 [Phytophthora sojae]
MASSSTLYNWETAVARDPDLQRIDAFVQRTIAKLPGAAPPSSSVGRGGSRYAPPVKSERPAPSPGSDTSMVSTRTGSRATARAPPSEGSNESPQFIDPSSYQSESSSEVDMREVNPMDELSDFESDASQQPQQEQQQQEPIENNAAAADNDVEMDADADAEEAEEEDKNTVCEVCKSSERERDIVLCDDCDAEYHVFCLSPPLPKVPEGTWYCPKCRVKYPDTEAASAAVDVRVMAEQLRAGGAAVENAGAVQTNETEPEAPTSGDVAAADGGADGPASFPISQALEGNPESANALLVHACSCDDVKCADAEFHVFCPHMKRFLRSVCWASHSDKWRSYRLARITAELFAYHAMNCKLEQCNVPLCVKIREEEIV